MIGREYLEGWIEKWETCNRSVTTDPSLAMQGQQGSVGQGQQGSVGQGQQGSVGQGSDGQGSTEQRSSQRRSQRS